MKLCIQILSLRLLPQSESGLESSIHARTLKILIHLLARIRRWRTPPNWSPAHWQEELRQTGFLAALTAEQELKLRENPELFAAIYRRILATVVSCYRNEWRYATRFTDFSAESETPRGTTECPSSDPGPDHLVFVRELLAALKNLPDTERSLVLRLCVDGCTESEVARSLNVSQRAVSKRKKAALVKLRRQLTSSFPGGSSKCPTATIIYTMSPAEIVQKQNIPVLKTRPRSNT